MEAVIFSSATSDALAASLPVFIFITLLAFLMHTFGRREGVKQYLRKSWFLTTVGLLAFWGTVYYGKLSLSSVNFEADMQVSGGQYVGAYINDLKIAPRQLPIVPNIRRVYRFEHIPTSLTYLRIDPSNIANVRISIYSLTIVSEGHVVRKFTPSDLKSWQRYNLAETPGDPAAFNIATSATADREGDFLGTEFSLIVSNHPAWLLYVTDVFQRAHSYSLIFIFFFLLFLLCGLSRRRGAIEAGLVSAVALIAYPLASFVAKAHGSPPAVSATVGYVNYTGYLKFRDYLISFVLLAVCAVFAWLASKYIPAGVPLPLHEEIIAEKRTNVWRSTLVPIAIFVWLLMLFLPDLNGILKQASHSSFQPIDWDSQYSILWDYLVHMGSLPFRDFWYPYAGFFVQGLAFPIGGLAICFQRVFTLWFLYLGLRYVVVLPRRGALLLFLVILFPLWLGEFPGWFRYLLAIDVVLLYVALQDSNRIDRRKRIAFALVVGFAFFLEPSQLLYAGVGMLIHSLWSVWAKLEFKGSLRATKAQLFSLVRRRVIDTGIPLLAGILPVLVFFAVKGMLAGFINFHMSLSAQSTYGALPAPVKDWTQPALQFDTMFMMVFFVMTLSLYAWFRNEGQRDTASIALFVTSFAGFMIIQKHITRPPILHQVEVYPYVCVLLYSLAVWPRRTKAQSIVVALFVGFVTGVVTYRGLVPSLYQPVMNAPATLSGNYDVLFHRKEEIRVMNATKFERARFSSFGAENAVIEALRSEFGWNPQQQVFVPGDDPVFYMLLGTSTPYVASTYNGSPITEQQHVLQWLHDRRPRFVIWNPSKSSFDTVPHLVRLPLLYQYVVENYLPVKTIAPYQILIANEAHAEANAAYWRQQLGTHLDFGHIPRLTKMSDYRNCSANDAAHCQTILFVRFPPTSVPGKTVLTLESPSGPFEVAFDIIAGTRECIIDLDRLWFRSFIGTTPRTALSVPGAEVQQEFRLRKSDVLY